MEGQEPERVYTVKVVVTLMFCVTFIGVLVWAVLHNKIDVPSFIAGVGPSVGLLLKDWFSASK